MKESVIKIELAGYEFSVEELRAFLNTIAETEGFWSNHTIRIDNTEDWYMLSAVSTDSDAGD